MNVEHYTKHHACIVALIIPTTRTSINKKRKITKTEKGCRDGLPTNDTNKGGYKSEGKYIRTKPYPSYIFSQQSKDVGVSFISSI